MRPDRYIYLEPEEVATLEEAYKNVSHHQVRMRAHCLLLSHQKHNMRALKVIFNVSHATVSNWLTAWETKGIVGLRNQSGQGRKPTLVEADLPLIKKKVQQNPQDIKAVRDELKTELGREFSAKTLKRFLKSLVGHPGDGGVSASKISKTPKSMSTKLRV